MNTTREFHVSVRGEREHLFFQSLIVRASTAAEAAEKAALHLQEQGCRFLGADPDEVWVTDQYPRTWALGRITDHGVVAESERIWVQPRFRKPGTRELASLTDSAFGGRSELAKAVVERPRSADAVTVVLRERASLFERFYRGAHLCGGAELRAATHDDVVDGTVQHLSNLLAQVRRRPFHVLVGDRTLVASFREICRHASWEEAEETLWPNIHLFLEPFEGGLAVFGGQSTLELVSKLFPEARLR